MAAIKKTRFKSKAVAVYIPANRDDCAAEIKRLGDLQRESIRLQTRMNDAIAEITQSHQPPIDQLKQQIEAAQTGIQAYCEAHRAELTHDGRTKTANFITGDVQWRQRPPSVSIRGVEAVLDNLKRLGLGRFIRTKEEPNKEAMLNEPEIVQGIAGITLVTGVEDFIVVPFEQETP